MDEGQDPSGYIFDEKVKADTVEQEPNAVSHVSVIDVGHSFL